MKILALEDQQPLDWDSPKARGKDVSGIRQSETTQGS